MKLVELKDLECELKEGDLREVGFFERGSIPEYELKKMIKELLKKVKTFDLILLRYNRKEFVYFAERALIQKKVAYYLKRQGYFVKIQEYDFSNVYYDEESRRLVMIGNDAVIVGRAWEDVCEVMGWAYEPI